MIWYTLRWIDRYHHTVWYRHQVTENEQWKDYWLSIDSLINNLLHNFPPPKIKLFKNPRKFYLWRWEQCLPSSSLQGSPISSMRVVEYNHKQFRVKLKILVLVNTSKVANILCALSLIMYPSFIQFLKFFKFLKMFWYRLSLCFLSVLFPE